MNRVYSRRICIAEISLLQKTRELVRELEEGIQ